MDRWLLVMNFLLASLSKVEGCILVAVGLAALVLILRIIDAIVLRVQSDPVLSGDTQGSLRWHQIRMNRLGSSEAKSAYIRNLMDRADRSSSAKVKDGLYLVCTDLVGGIGGPIYEEVRERFYQARAAKG